MDVFSQIAVVLAVCVIAGGLATLVRLPPLVGFLIAGVAVGPDGLGVVAATEEIALLGEIGIALLLFVVGLELDPRVVRRLGPVVLATGSAQVLVTAAMGFGLATLAGAAPVTAAYLAAATAFSSTVVVIKLLGDRREIEQLHGRLAVGILIVQDLVVVVLLIVVTATAGDGGAIQDQAVSLVLGGGLLLVGVALLARFALPHVTHLAARQPELLVLVAVTWSVAVAAAAHVLGFGVEVGAILAGVALSTSRYREAISGRLTTLRDFLLVFFFIDLGTHLELGGGGNGLLMVGLLSAFVLLVKPLLVAGFATALGFRADVGIRAGLNLAQISEFSLILVALGVGLGQLDGQTAGTVTLIAVVTITVSTFLSARTERLTPRIRGPLLSLENRTRTRDLGMEVPPGLEPTYVIVGFGRLGRQLVGGLERAGETVLAVDFDPRHHHAPPGGPPVVYGDAEDPALPDQLPLESVRWVVSTLRDNRANRQLAASLRHHGFTGRLALSADHDHEIEELRATGADIVVRPFHAAAAPLMRQLTEHDHRADG